MKTEQIKMGAQVRISSQQLRARVWILVGVELSERGLTLTLERDGTDNPPRRVGHGLRGSVMVDKTNAERQAAYRQRQAEQAAGKCAASSHKDDHAAIKNPGRARHTLGCLCQNGA
ncbi:MAG: hypothetical protein IPL29_02585 [Propionivibrio sp.]|nr:hypothetical protein [Propionivibrio sp.]